MMSKTNIDGPSWNVRGRIFILFDSVANGEEL